jgi:hypothetical protein
MDNLFHEMCKSETNTRQEAARHNVRDESMDDR